MDFAYPSLHPPPQFAFFTTFYVNHRFTLVSQKPFPIDAIG